MGRGKALVSLSVSPDLKKSLMFRNIDIFFYHMCPCLHEDDTPSQSQIAVHLMSQTLIADIPIKSKYVSILSNYLHNYILLVCDIL